MTASAAGDIANSLSREVPRMAVGRRRTVRDQARNIRPPDAGARSHHAGGTQFSKERFSRRCYGIVKRSPSAAGRPGDGVARPDKGVAALPSTRSRFSHALIRACHPTTSLPPRHRGGHGGCIAPRDCRFRGVRPVGVVQCGGVSITKGILGLSQPRAAHRERCRAGAALVCQNPAILGVSTSARRSPATCTGGVSHVA